MSNPYSHYPDFYQAEPKHIPEPIATVLENYSNIPRNQQLEHILKVRDRAYKARPYPCLGRFRFIELDLSTHPLYHEYVLPQLQKPSSDDAKNVKPLFLDLGTCLGQDLRKLIYDGADPTLTYGSDIVPDFISAGYDLFQDEGRFPHDHFICPADVFDRSEHNNLAALDGKVDILHATAVFHLFSGEQQAAVAERCLKLLRKTPGTRVLVLGAQVGNVNARESVRQDGAKRFRHDEESWRELWEYVGRKEEFREIVKKVEVKAVLKERKIGDAEQSKHIGTTEDGFRWMVWQVWIEF